MNLAKLERRLAKVEAVLDKVRDQAYDLPWGTMKRAKASRNHDFYAQEKMKLKEQIEQLKKEKQ